MAIDANFRLKRRMVSNDARDPSLAPGAGYFVLNDEYTEFLLKHVGQDEVSVILHHFKSMLKMIMADQYVYRICSITLCKPKMVKGLCDKWR